MRCSVVDCIVVFTAALLVACGGGTPSPKNEGDETHKASSESKEEAAPSVDAGSAVAETKTAAAPEQTPAASTPVASDSSPPSGDDPWMASHQMPPKDVLQTMRGAKAKVEACHRAGVKRDPSASGDVKIRFVVTHDGAVRVWKDQDSTMTDEEVTKCVGEVIKGLKFPKQKSPGDAWGVYRINFSG